MGVFTTLAPGLILQLKAMWQHSPLFLPKCRMSVVRKKLGKSLGKARRKLGNRNAVSENVFRIESRAKYENEQTRGCSRCLARIFPSSQQLFFKICLVFL